MLSLVLFGLLVSVALDAGAQTSCPMTVEASYSNNDRWTWSSSPKGTVETGDFFWAECSNALLTAEVDERLVIVMSNGAEADVAGMERRSVVRLVARTLAMMTTPNEMRVVPPSRHNDAAP